MADRFWITRIFADEFGFSDLRSNYSRVYSWMANQLGHMTLGLALTLFFFWIHNTVIALAAALEAHPQWVLVGAGAAIGLAALLWLAGEAIFDFCASILKTDVPNAEFIYQTLFVVLVIAPFALLALVEGDGPKPDLSATNGALLGFAAGVIALGAGLAIVGIWRKPGPEAVAVPEQGADTGRWPRVLATALVLVPGLSALGAWSLGFIALRAEAVAGIAAATLVGALIAYRSRGIPIQSLRENGAARGYIPVHRTARLLAMFVVLAPGLVVLLAWTQGAPPVPVTVIATLVAATLFGLILVFLSMDIRFTIIGLTALIGASIIGFGAALAHVPVIGLHRCETGLPGGILFSVMTTLLVAIWAQRARFFDRFFYAMWAVALGFAFWWLATQRPDPNWDVARAGAMASMVIWAIKEFSSDLPKVFDELAKVEATRPPLNCADYRNEEGQPAVVPDHGTSLAGFYVNTAMWDVRTDASFYLAGAWIGAGVLTDESLLFFKSEWAVGTEVVGLLIFGFFFIAGGRNWAYRQKAIDQSGAARGHMLAVLDLSTELRNYTGYDWAKPVPGPPPLPEPEPRDKLYRLATGWSPNEKSERKDGQDPKAAPAKETSGKLDADGVFHLDHLLVIGPPRLNQQFADAMVTEAVLKDLSPQMFADLKAEEHWRRARKLDIALLERYDLDGLTKAQLPYTPIWNADYIPRLEPEKASEEKDKATKVDKVEDEKTEAPPLPLRRIQATEHDQPNIPSANLLAVIGYMPTDKDIRRGLRTIFGAEGTRTKVDTVIWTFASARLKKPDQTSDEPAALEVDQPVPAAGAEEAPVSLSAAPGPAVAAAGDGKGGDGPSKTVPVALRPWADPTSTGDIGRIARDWARRFQEILDQEMQEIGRAEKTKLGVLILKARD